ncbi:hypothetical protein [uncultured Salegentibacter sp.]|uniref:hypothetical protein n=1 Tax=uncultured Salegentibacter sp. TaxID=259320 RepID=UPI0025922FC9|nr:hypothetical protein [uncultured Salegentibacter sp.]
MTSDKSTEKSLEYLDKILESLVAYATAYTLSFEELYKQVNNRDFKSDNKFNAMNHLISISDDKNFFDFVISDNQKALGEKLVEACYYLNKNGFIRISPNFDVKITFSGILKHSFGFVQDYQKEIESERRLHQVEEIQKNQNRWIIALTFLIAVGTLVSSYYYLILICNET